MTDLLTVSQLDLHVGENQVLHDVAFNVRSGTCLALVGETGAGKSLTCRVVAGLTGHLKAAKISGNLDFDGIDLTSLNRRGWRRVHGRQVGFIPQASLSALDPLRRVGSQLLETAKYLDVPKKDTTKRSLYLLDRVHFDDPERVMRSYPHELSGGMRQRVMIALALMGSPKLLIADESTTALDVTVQKSILTLLAELKQDSNLSMILVSHDLSVVETIADDVVIMNKGRVVESGAVSQVLTEPQDEYSKKLMAARPDRLTTSPQGALSITEATPAGAERPHD